MLDKVESTRRFFKLKNDIMFKIVFANPEKLYLLERLIKEVIKEDIKVISVIPTELPKNNMIIRHKVLDVIATSNDVTYNIEVNTENSTYLRRRNAAYIFKMYSDSIKVNESYSNMNRFIQINLTDSGTKKMPLYDKYELVSLKTKERFIDNLEIYEIDISKIDKECYNENGLSVIGLLNMDKEELQMVHGDEIMEEIKNKALELNNSDEVFELIDAERDNQMIMNTLKDEYYERGMNKGIEQGTKQGIEQGKNETKLDIAKEMLKKNLSLKDIVEITGLTKEEIDKLK